MSTNTQRDEYTGATAMTRDDIIRMAKEAGFNQILATIAGEDVWIDDGFYVKEMERFAALVSAEKDKEIERLRDALKWSRDVDCGCCSDCVEPPAEFRDLIEWADEIKRRQA